MKALVFFVSVPQWPALQVLGRVQRRLFYSGPLATVRLVDIPEPELPSKGGHILICDLSL